MVSARPLQRILVANRGEIALRIMRTCREMGIEAIAIYGDGEEYASHARYADEAYSLPEWSGLPYLNVDGIVDIARSARADGVHPGYGFLAENAGFARAVSNAGLTFIGPSPEAIATMGDKIAARRVAQEAGVPTVPGTLEPVADLESAAEVAASLGYPVAVKASGGGGGRGFRVAHDAAGLPEAFAGASGEAARYFANPDVYLERYFARPRHIEVQVMADAHGNVMALGERDCSIQRRHQKLIEETPSTAVGPELRERLFAASVSLARAVNYLGAGTVEYLLDETGDFHFLEMNTRIQVEHTVTEMVTGIDLVREQILVAQGEPLSFAQDDLVPQGWAIECRINAEDPGRGFTPVPGTVTRYHEPSGFGVRVDAALGASEAIQPRYDSMISKLVVWGRSRPEAVSRMERALADYTIEGVPTTIPFHRNVMRHPRFRLGEISTSFLTDAAEVVPAPVGQDITPPELPDAPVQDLLIEVNGRRYETRVRGAVVADSGANGASPVQRRSRRGKGTTVQASQDDLVSPIHGTVIRVAVEEGDHVEAGQVVCVIEAMKMENELAAHKGGIVRGVSIAVGGTVSIGQAVLSILDA